MLEENKEELADNEKTNVTPKSTPYSKRFSKRGLMEQKNNAELVNFNHNLHVYVQEFKRTKSNRKFRLFIKTKNNQNNLLTK